MKQGILVLLLLSVALASCHKEEKDRYKVAGKWYIHSLLVDDVANNNSQEYTDAGELRLADNRDAMYNGAALSFTKHTPTSIKDFMELTSNDPADAVSSWYPGPSGTERLTLWRSGGLHDEFLMFTVASLSRKEMMLTYVRTNNGEMTYKEVWQLGRE